MKSRNIVAGWPRGRSCNTPYGQAEGGYTAWWMFFRVRDPFERIELIAEIEAERMYTAGQQLMTDEYRRRRQCGQDLELEFKSLRPVCGIEIPQTWVIYAQKLMAHKHPTGATVTLNGERDASMLNDESMKLLLAAEHALRSYEYGNSATDLGKNIADAILDYRLRRIQQLCGI